MVDERENYSDLKRPQKGTIPSNYRPITYLQIRNYAKYLTKIWLTFVTIICIIFNELLKNIIKNEQKLYVVILTGRMNVVQMKSV